MSKRKDGQVRGKYTLEFKLEAVRPAIARIADAAKACFVLKHQAQWALCAEVRYDFAQRVGEFFSQSSRACGSPWGCWVSGASLRRIFHRAPSAPRMTSSRKLRVIPPRRSFLCVGR